MHLCVCEMQRQNDTAEQTVTSYVAAILDLDLFAEDDDGSGRTADVSASRTALLLPSTSSPPPPPPADGSAATVP